MTTTPQPQTMTTTPQPANMTTTRARTVPVLSYENPTAGSVKATRKELHRLGVTDAEIDAGEKRFDIETRGAWGVCSKLRAVVKTGEFGEYSRMLWSQFYSMRTMSKPNQTGTCIEGYVSIRGKKSTCFTSSQLFELPCGKLVDVAVIFSRSKIKR